MLLLLHLGGCSSKPKLLPQNEISEPVFQTTHLTGLGARLVPGWVREPGSDGHANVLDFAPYAYLERNVNSWSGFSLWPGFWNFLLTGEQYAEGGNLKVRKLHLSLRGGIDGFAFSSRDGLQFTGLAQLAGKFLLDGNWFVGAESGRRLFDVAELGYGLDFLTASLGTQLSPRNSLRLTYDLSRFHLGGTMSAKTGGITYYDGDTRTQLALRHAFYATPNQAFGPLAAVSFRNGGFVDGYSLGIGLHYRYLFE